MLWTRVEDRGYWSRGDRAECVGAGWADGAEVGGRRERMGGGPGFVGPIGGRGLWWDRIYDE